jgi:hypothetical protein
MVAIVFLANPSIFGLPRSPQCSRSPSSRVEQLVFVVEYIGMIRDTWAGGCTQGNDRKVGNDVKRRHLLRSPIIRGIHHRTSYCPGLFRLVPIQLLDNGPRHSSNCQPVGACNPLRMLPDLVARPQ